MHPAPKGGRAGARRASCQSWRLGVGLALLRKSILIDMDKDENASVFSAESIKNPVDFHVHLFLLLSSL
jgi:hypothetical protein